MSKAISLTRIVSNAETSAPFRFCLRALDRLLGIAEMNRLYQAHDMAGLPKEEFARKLLDILEVNVVGGEDLQHKIVSDGPLVIASNHPFGGIEGVILCLLIGQIRPDLKVMANQGLRLFAELKDYFIFADPLKSHNPRNAAPIRSAIRHVKSGGALLIFPAGRVAYYQKDKQRVSDHDWNRVVATIVRTSHAQFQPVFVSGQNSALFYRLGRIYYRMRLLMLAHELLNKRGAQITLTAGHAIPPERFNRAHDDQTLADVCRLSTYAQDPLWRNPWPADKVIKLQPIASPVPTKDITRELDALPREQHLLDYKNFAVYFGYQHQLPQTVREIARLREWVFRAHNEGSGEPIDTDPFDATYTHLFVVERNSTKVIGAYRMGRSDEILQTQGMEGLYLTRMFRFSEGFVNRREPCLEMGRSFLIPEYQRSYQGLYLLWRGIGAFVCRFPHYRHLYGTVSISKLYDARSVALIRDGLIASDAKSTVLAHQSFSFPLHAEIRDFAQSQLLRPHLKTLLGTIETDGKDIPILVKHYEKLGAEFHCVGIDRNFNHTPGMLLSVNLAKAPHKMLKQYMGEAWRDFMSWRERC